MYYYMPHSGRFEQSSRSMARGSSLAPSSYSSRYSLDDDVLYTPYRPSFHHAYDTTGNENYTRSQVNKELMMSSAAMDDNYDLSTRSRNRDRDIIAAANRAIVDCEIHSSPRSAVAARRVMRGQSTPPPSIRTSYQTSSNTEAALLGSKVNVVLPERKTRTPRSLYAQNIVRQIKNRSSREEVSPPITATSGLRAHKPVYTPSLIKPIHAAEGIKKPGIMSWQYRLDNYTNPDDIIYCPRSLNSVKEQVRQVKEKLDRHKQLMDRYLEKDDGLSAEDRQAIAVSKAYLGARA